MAKLHKVVVAFQHKHEKMSMSYAQNFLLKNKPFFIVEEESSFPRRNNDLIPSATWLWSSRVKYPHALNL